MDTINENAKSGFVRLKKLLRSWIDRILQPACVSKSPPDPGVLMIQIDGLSYRQVQKAILKDRLPYLRRLSEQENYNLKRSYSGMPSTTPAVQAELFYGVKSSVPAFSFYDREQKKKQTLMFPTSANEIARWLESVGTPLLKEGTSYSNIFSGGAESARYCIQTMRLRSFRHLVSSVKLFIIMLKPTKFLRMGGYGILETGLAMYDFFRGVGKGRDVFQELKFIPMRVLVCILIRELIRTRAKMDVTRGVRIVHASFLGYDEQAHRRGPDSAFAHWTLKGIDGVIGDIHRVAKKSKCRKYQMVVYSDHGQELVVSYQKRFGKSVQEAIEDAILKSNTDMGLSEEKKKRSSRILDKRARGLFFKKVRKDDKDRVRNGLDRMVVTAMGPFGHIYLGTSLSDQSKEKLAGTLVRDANIPLVFFTSENKVIAMNKKGNFDLEVSFREILGPEHPLPEWTTRDLVRICRHRHAGDLIISGWVPEGQPVTFEVQNGGHGGPGREETSGFVLVPDTMDNPDRRVFRPLELRARILSLFENKNDHKNKIDVPRVMIK